MSLELQRPLAVIDLESTGVSPERDRIVEIAILKVHPDGHEDFRCRRVNPGCAIPPGATAVHGITDADVVDAPTFGAYANGINEFLADCDFAGFGIARFDLPMLRSEMWRTKGIDFRWRDRGVVDSMLIYHQMHPRTLAAAMQEYCGKPFEQGHAASVDVRAALAVLLAQLDRHSELPKTVPDLHALHHAETAAWVDHDGKFVWADDEAIMGFGKHSGMSLRDIATNERDYLDWILGGDFAPDVKEIVRNALLDSFPSR